MFSATVRWRYALAQAPFLPCSATESWGLTTVFVPPPPSAGTGGDGGLHRCTFAAAVHGGHEPGRQSSRGHGLHRLCRCHYGSNRGIAGSILDHCRGRETRRAPLPIHLVLFTLPPPRFPTLPSAPPRPRPPTCPSRPPTFRFADVFRGNLRCLEKPLGLYLSSGECC